MIHRKTDHDRELPEPKKRIPWGLFFRTACKVTDWVVKALPFIARLIDIDKMFDG